MNVVKANGETVPYDPEKIRLSLSRAKVKPDLIEQVIETVNPEIYDQIPTSTLYRIVFDKLKKLKRGVAGKYHLKKAVMALGPTGFPFEKFVAAIWKADQFTVSTGMIIRGACVSHEVDVIARRRDLQHFVECKHHSVPGKICTVKNALYFHARFLDLEKRVADPSNSRKTNKGWLVTNTRFTSEAIRYGNCVGLGLLSWDYPAKSGLRERIDKHGLHPITCLTSLSRKQKQNLMDKMIVLCPDLCRRPELLGEVGIRGKRAERVIREAAAICEHLDHRDV